MADEAGLVAAVAAAVEADAVGLDVEWRPGRERCPQPPASLLQVARPLCMWVPLICGDVLHHLGELVGASNSQFFLNDFGPAS